MASRATVRLPIPLWLAFAGAAMQAISLGTDYYVWQGRRQSAWFGIPHTSELMLLSALITVTLVIMVALGRSPVGARRVGQIIGAIGLIASLQLGYRMIAPPFGGRIPAHATIIGDSCLYYCLPSEAAAVDFLPGIWLALAGCLMMCLAGFAHTYLGTEEDVTARLWRSETQTGMSPWLGLAAVGAIGQFVLGYTFFTFYRTQRAGGAVTSWSGWLPTPHTASLVLAVSVIVIALAWSARRRKAPMSPMALGVIAAVLGALSAARIAYRIWQPPFAAPVLEIGPAAYLALASAIAIAVGGSVHAITHQSPRIVRL